MDYIITEEDLIKEAELSKLWGSDNKDINSLKTNIYFNRLVNDIYSQLEIEIKSRGIEWKGVSSTIEYIVGECWCDFQFPYNGTEWNEEALQKLEEIKVNMVNKLLNDLEDCYLSKDAWF